jgi:hypothetical protein
MPYDLRRRLRRLDLATRFGAAAGLFTVSIGLARDWPWLEAAGFVFAALAVVVPNWIALELMSFDEARRDSLPRPTPEDLWREIRAQSGTSREWSFESDATSGSRPTIH